MSKWNYSSKTGWKNTRYKKVKPVDTSIEMQCKCGAKWKVPSGKDAMCLMCKTILRQGEDICDKSE